VPESLSMRWRTRITDLTKSRKDPLRDKASSEEEQMIERRILADAVLSTIVRASCCVPPDVRSAIEMARERETQPISKRAFAHTLQSLDRCYERGNPACGDTGWPLFYCKIGNDAQIEGGILGLEEVSKQAVIKATSEGLLRKTMKHPLTGADPGTNIGMNMPSFTYRFAPGDSVQVTFVPKGGGGELFGGSRYAVIAFGDGVVGIEKFIVDSYVSGVRAGAICPPAIVGVGIGGTFDVSAKLAKEAAVLRVIGSRHPEPQIARIEKDLFDALGELKVGAMGSGGDISVLGVNVEYAHTHIAGITVAMNANCIIARRATSRIHADGQVEELDDPCWFDGR